MYVRLDAALGHQDAAEIDRLAPADAWVGVDGLHISLRAWLHSVVRRGWTWRSEVTEFYLSGQNATSLVRHHITSNSNGTSHESSVTYRDTWVRQGGRWAWREAIELSEQSNIPATTTEAAQPVIAELKQRAKPLATARAGQGFDDLKAFGDAVGNARIVALGEATHGTQEFYQMKHRLLEYLVREKGFTVLALEVNWPDSLAVDRYIKTGEGDLNRSLIPAFDETRVMVEWMRSFNRNAAGGRLLTYTSFDMQGVAEPANVVLSYLRHYAPQEASGAEAAYADANRIWRDRSNVFLVDASRVASRVDQVVQTFDSHRSDWTAISSPEAWRDARQAAAIVVQACQMRVEANGLGYRDKMMAKNIEWLADYAHPKEKIVISAHNGHVGMDSGSNDRRMGCWLRDRFRQDLYVVGFAFRRGQVWATGIEDGKRKGNAPWPVDPSPERSGDGILSAAGLSIFFLNMAAVPPDGALVRWLGQEHLFHEIGGLVGIGSQSSNLCGRALSRSFDGLVFFEETHGSHPIGASANSH